MSLVTPKMWDDKHFLSMSSEGKLLWLYLLTGVSGGVPGLIKGGVGAYADALHWDYPVAEAAMRELVNTSMIQFDREARMICIPNAPKYSPCSNANVIKGWYRRWGDLAESPLKYSHIESIRAAFSSKDWFDDVWRVTFGQVKVPEPSKQVPLFQQSSLITPSSKKVNDSNTGETNAKPLPNGKANSSANKTVADITITTNRNSNHNRKPQTSNLPRVTRETLEGVYAGYPKKTGKAKGLDALERLKLKPEQFSRYQDCVEWMGHAWSGHDTQFCPGFQAFVNGKRWEDEDWPAPSVGGQKESGRYVTVDDMDGLIALAEERENTNEGT